MTAVLDALEVLRKHIVPSEEELMRLRQRIDTVCRERSDWRRRAEAAEAEMTAVKNALARHGFLHRDYINLQSRVESAITAPRHELEQKIRDHNRAAISLEDARRDLQHHTTCMVQLYNKSAGHILFGLGEPPDYMEIHTAINAAIDAAAKEKATPI